MNKFEGHGSGEAKIRYLDADFQVITPGTHVRCAVTGAVIPLEELKYWSVERQEAYADVAASVKADEIAGILPSQHNAQSLRFL